MTQSRRQLIISAGITGFAGLGGCLRLTSDDTSTPESDGSESPFYSSRPDAIETAASFAESESYDLDIGGDDPDRLRYDDTAGSYGFAGGSDGSTLHSQDLFVVSTDGPINFGGGLGRRLRIRELITESTAVFEPATDAPTVSIKDNLEIEFVGTGELRYDMLQVGDSDVTGTWNINEQPFQKYAFGRYVVELLDGDDVIGHTAATTKLTGYQWKLGQTDNSAFITRHPAVKESWEIEFTLEEGNTVVGAVHRPSDHVFEVDLSEFDVSAGQYSYRLSAYDGEDTTRENQIFQLVPIKADLFLE